VSITDQDVFSRKRDLAPVDLPYELDEADYSRNPKSSADRSYSLVGFLDYLHLAVKE
jgi:hypothetical protein